MQDSLPSGEKAVAKVPTAVAVDLQIIQRQHGKMSGLAGLFIELILFFLLDVLLQWTGEAVVFLCTFGREKPIFRISGNNTSASSAPSSKPRRLIGLAFWIVVLLAFRYSPE